SNGSARWSALVATSCAGSVTSKSPADEPCAGGRRGSAYQPKRRRLRPVSRWTTFAPRRSSRVVRVAPRRASIVSLTFLTPAIANGTATAAITQRAIILGNTAASIQRLRRLTGVEYPADGAGNRADPRRPDLHVHHDDPGGSARESPHGVAGGGVRRRFVVLRLRRQPEGRGDCDAPAGQRRLQHEEQRLGLGVRTRRGGT